MELRITPCYAAVLALLFVLLSARVISARRTSRVVLGSGDDPGLERRVRVHGNFAEYVPLALLLLGMAELRGAGPILLHGLGLTLVGARVLHALGLSRTPEDLRLRTVGMAGTFTVLTVTALLLLVG
jgi:uncharacterized membrane protein YecN with MAPEG domain